jgi:Flp pilus assembly protein TadD
VFDLKRVRPLDAVIALVGVVVVVLAIYLGYSVWAQRRLVASSVPSARAVEQVAAEVRKKPNDLDARMRLAQALAVAGRDSEAVDQYKAALQISKDFTPAISGLGFIALKQKQWATGEGYFRKAVDILQAKQAGARDPQLETAYFYLGTALMEQRKYEDAAGYFKQALTLRRDASDTHYALAVTYKQLGLDDKYRQELESTLLFDPKMPEANYDYALVLLKVGDKASAAEHLRASVDAAPGVDKPKKALDELGPFADRLAAAQKLMSTDPAAALVEARIASALEPKDVEALMLTANLYAKSGDKAKAATFYNKVLAVVPGNPEALAGLKQVNNGN